MNIHVCKYEPATVNLSLDFELQYCGNYFGEREDACIQFNCALHALPIGWGWIGRIFAVGANRKSEAIHT